MEALSILIIIVLIVVLIKLNSFKKKNSMEIKDLQKSLKDIDRKINIIGQNLANNIEKDNEGASKETAQTYQAVKSKTDEKIQSEIIVEKEKLISEEKKEQLELEENEQIIQERIKQITETKKEDVSSSIKKAPVKTSPIIKPKLKKKKKTFLEKNPDLEKFIGENLINKIGIVILVLGLGFLVKYAIDKNWINEIGRVAIGVLSATALIGLAHKLRKGYKPFSSVLIGGGLALLYFTITLAFHTEGYPLYQQQTTTFIILILITIFAVFLSITYNRIEIAILAILGGFGSPLMVSTGSGNHIVLFSYLTVLNVGMLVLSYYKKWRLVNIVSFILTMLLFGSWLASEIFDARYSKFSSAIIFATVFYVIFFLMNIIYNIKYKLNFKVGDILLLLSNTFIYFSFVMIMLQHIGNGMYNGLFAVLLGVFNFGFAYFVHKRQEQNKNLFYLLIGLVFTFITLAVPLQLKGNYITLFWATESVLLLWLSQKSNFKIMKVGSVIVLALMFISLIMDWQNNYNTYSFLGDDYVKEFKIVFNKMFITSMFAAASLIATSFLLKKETDEKAWFLPIKEYKLVIPFLTIVILYIGGLLEVNYQAYHYFVNYISREVATITYNAVFILLLLIFAYKKNIKEITVFSVFASIIFVFIFLYSISTTYASSIYAIIENVGSMHSILLIFRWLSIISVYLISVLIFKLSKRIEFLNNKNFSKLSIVFLVFTILYILSADLDTIGLLITKNIDILQDTQKTGYTILWGVSSFILMILGMKLKKQTLRIFSLALFAITLIKLFVYDISNISEGGKIIAFILLGVLLLVISFMYQKVKKLVADDEAVVKEDTENK